MAAPPFRNEPWYHGDISRQQGDAVLLGPACETGSFLIRDSKRSPSGYTLSMRTPEGKSKHYQIGRQGEKWVLVGAGENPETFPDLATLLKHYQKGTSAMPQALVKPAPREQSAGLGLNTNEGDYVDLSPDMPAVSGVVHSVTISTPLGLSFRGDDGGIFVVTKIKPGSNSATSTKVKVGYHIVSVNGTAVQNKPKEDVTALIKASQGKCTLELRDVLAVGPTPKAPKRAAPAPTKAEQPPAVPPRSAAPPAAPARAPKKKQKTTFQVSIPSPLGLSYRKEEGSGAFVVSKIKVESNTEKNGKVAVGMEIMAVNGKSVAGLEKEGVTALIKASVGDAVLVFKIPGAAAAPLAQQQSDPNRARRAPGPSSEQPPRRPPPVARAPMQPSGPPVKHDFFSIVQNTEGMGSNAHLTGTVSAWDMVNSAPKLADGAQSAPMMTTSKRVGDWNHTLRASRVMRALTKKSQIDREANEVVVPPDYTVREVLGLGEESVLLKPNRTRDLLKKWAWVSIIVAFIVLIGSIASFAFAAKLAFSYPDVSELSTDGMMFNSSSTCPVATQSCCRGCSTPDECSKCADTSVLELTCCPTSASHLDEDQGFICAATLLVFLFCIVAIGIQMWYLLRFKYDNGAWVDYVPPSGFDAHVNEMARSMRQYLLEDESLERKVRKETQFAGPSDASVTVYKALPKDHKLKPEEGDALQIKVHEKPGWPFTASASVLVIVILLYLVVMQSFVAVKTDMECYSCEQRATWYLARDATVASTTALKWIALAELLLSLFLTAIVYLITPLQFGDGVAKLAPVSHQEVVDIAPMLNMLRALPSSSSIQALETGAVAENDTSVVVNALQAHAAAEKPKTAQDDSEGPLVIKEPVWINILITEHDAGISVVNLGKGNLISLVATASQAYKARVPVGARLCAVDSVDTSNSSQRQAESALKQAFAPLTLELAKPLGIASARGEDGRLFVKAIKEDGSVAKAMQVKEGMRILTVDGYSTVGMGKKDFSGIVKASAGETIKVVFGGSVTLMLAARDYFPYKPPLQEQVVQYQSPMTTTVVNPIFSSLAQNVVTPESPYKVFPSAPDRISVETPTVTLSDQGDGSVDIKTTTAGARIYFTTDGSTPSATGTGSSMWYGLTKPHMDRRAGNSFIVRAIARREGMKHSQIAEGIFDVTATPGPVIEFRTPNPAQHDPHHFMEVHITCASSGSLINYGIDGAFVGADKDGDGKLSLEECMAQGMTEKVFKSIDNDNNGSLDLAEFNAWRAKQNMRATIRYNSANPPVVPIDGSTITIVAKAIGNHLAWSDPVVASFTAPGLATPTVTSQVSVDMAHFTFASSDKDVEYWYMIGEHQGDGTAADKGLPAIAGPNLGEPGPSTSSFAYPMLSTAYPSTINIFSSQLEPVIVGGSKYRLIKDAGKAKAVVKVKLGGIGSTPCQVFTRKAGSISSQVAFTTITVQQCKTPTISPNTFEELTSMENNQAIKIETETKDVQIFYTLDGSTPTEGRKATNEYDPNHPLRLFVSRDPKTIKVQVIKKNWVASPVVEKTYTRPKTDAIEGGLDLKGTFLHKKEVDTSGGPRRGRRSSVSAMPVISNGSFLVSKDGATKSVKDLLSSETKQEYGNNELQSWKTRNSKEADTTEGHAKREAERAAEQRRVKDDETIRKAFGVGNTAGAIEDATFEWLWDEVSEDLELWHDFLKRSATRYGNHGDGPYEDFIADLGPMSQYRKKSALDPLIGTRDPKKFEPKSAVSAGEEREKSIQRLKSLEQMNLKLRDLDRVRSQIGKLYSVVENFEDGQFDKNLTKDELSVVSSGLAWLRDRPKVLRGAKPSDRNPKHANLSHLEIFFMTITEKRNTETVDLLEVLAELHPSVIKGRMDAKKKEEADRVAKEKAEKAAAEPAALDNEGGASAAKAAFESGDANNASAIRKQDDLDAEGNVGEVREKMKGKLSNLLQRHSTHEIEAGEAKPSLLVAPEKGNADERKAIKKSKANNFLDEIKQASDRQDTHRKEMEAAKEARNESAAVENAADVARRAKDKEAVRKAQDEKRASNGSMQDELKGRLSSISDGSSTLGGKAASREPLRLTVIAPVNSKASDGEKHPWEEVRLPAGWAQTYGDGELLVQWKDQGGGNLKGHLFGRIDSGGEWVRLSTEVAQHTWTTKSFPLPAAWFDGSGGEATLELAYVVNLGGGAGHELYVKAGATITFNPTVSVCLSCGGDGKCHGKWATPHPNHGDMGSCGGTGYHRSGSPKVVPDFYGCGACGGSGDDYGRGGSKVFGDGKCTLCKGGK